MGPKEASIKLLMEQDAGKLFFCPFSLGLQAVIYYVTMCGTPHVCALNRGRPVESGSSPELTPTHAGFSLLTWHCPLACSCHVSSWEPRSAHCR
jgi:hypothetical protein